MFIRYKLACEGYSTEKSQDLAMQLNDFCCFSGLTFTPSRKLSYFLLYLFRSIAF